MIIFVNKGMMMINKKIIITVDKRLITNKMMINKKMIVNKRMGIILDKRMIMNKRRIINVKKGLMIDDRGQKTGHYHDFEPEDDHGHDLI